MSKMKLSIWDREFEIEVTYQVFKDGEKKQGQIDSFEEFKKKFTVIDPESKSESVCLGAESLDSVKKYILSHEGEENGMESVDNIFKYVIPKMIYVPQNKGPVIALLCDYKFDLEHGIAVVFKNGSIDRIGEQDIIL